MKIPKDYLLKQGDVIAVRATVRFDMEVGDDRVHVRVDGHRDAVVPLDDVLSLERRTWAVGDKVRSVDDYTDRGEVRAFEDGVAWVKLLSGAFSTYASLSLEVDPAEAAAEADPPEPPLARAVPRHVQP